MKLYAFSIGDKLMLKKPWTFTVQFEYWNQNFLNLLGLLPDRYSYAHLMGWKDADGNCYKDCDFYNPDKHAAKWEVTLPIKTVLIVGRIFIHKRDKGSDSIIFVIEQTTHEKIGKEKPRFWVKLEFTNEIEFEVLNAF